MRLESFRRALESAHDGVDFPILRVRMCFETSKFIKGLTLIPFRMTG